MQPAERLAVGFAAALRAAGLSEPVGVVVTFTNALGLVGIDSRQSVYWAGRATLVRRPEDVGVYDRVFNSFWTGHLGLAPAEPEPLSLSVAVDEPGQAPPDAPAERDHDAPEVIVRYSPVEVLRHKDFAGLDAGEWAEAHRLLAALRISRDLRRSRRLRASRRRGYPDLRSTVRGSLATAGEPVRPGWRSPSTRPRRMVLLADVSGSMEPYARAVLRFAQAAVAARGPGRVEVFTLGTRLTRVTRELAGRDPDAAIRRACSVVADWSGGTKLGEGLGEFNDRWGARGMAHGAVVVVLSDGWDRGEPDRLSAEMRRLGRIARRIVWVNPLKASVGYAPLARGMAAALPYVDNFVEGHSLAALEDLAVLIGGEHP